MGGGSAAKSSFNDCCLSAKDRALEVSFGFCESAINIFCNKQKEMSKACVHKIQGGEEIPACLNFLPFSYPPTYRSQCTALLP